MAEGLWKAGIIGCGRIAGIKDFPREKTSFIGTHAQAYFQHPEFQMVAVAEPNDAALKLFQDTWKIPNGYSRLSDMLNSEKLDVLSLCSPNEFHAKQIIDILLSSNSPKIIFSEKPVCLARQEYIDIKEKVKRSNSIVIVNHSRRFDPGHMTLCELIKSGEFGDFLQGWGHYYGGWYNNGCHMVDVLGMMFNEKPIIGSVQMGAKGKRDDVCLDVALLFGSSLVKLKGFDESYYQIFEIELRFTKGRVLIHDFGSAIEFEVVEKNIAGEQVLIPHKRSPLKGLDSPLRHAISIFSENLKGNDTLENRGILFDDVYDTMDILWGAKEKLAMTT